MAKVAEKSAESGASPFPLTAPLPLEEALSLSQSWAQSLLAGPDRAVKLLSSSFTMHAGMEPFSFCQSESELLREDAEALGFGALDLRADVSWAPQIGAWRFWLSIPGLDSALRIFSHRLLRMDEDGVLGNSLPFEAIGRTAFARGQGAWRKALLPGFGLESAQPCAAGAQTPRFLCAQDNQLARVFWKIPADDFSEGISHLSALGFGREIKLPVLLPGIGSRGFQGMLFPELGGFSGTDSLSAMAPAHALYPESLTVIFASGARKTLRRPTPGEEHSFDEPIVCAVLSDRTGCDWLSFSKPHLEAIDHL